MSVDGFTAINFIEGFRIIWSMKVDDRLGDVQRKICLLIETPSTRVVEIGRKGDRPEKKWPATGEMVLEMRRSPPRVESNETGWLRVLLGSEEKKECCVQTRCYNTIA